MRKSFLSVLSFIVTFTLLFTTFVFVPNTVYADVSSIVVTPYPKVSGQIASYRIAFNINAPLNGGTDSISVVFPKETIIDSTISSGNISVNPKKLIPADYVLNYQTGTVTLLNPLQKGDRITANYRYEAGVDYTQLPRNVKFYDLTYPAGDPRRGNGVLDPGEWIYEDRDNDSRITVGDRRLCVIIEGVNTYRQGSLVQTGDSDIGATETRPLTSYSYTNLKFVDNDQNGIFSENDWLIDDRDNSYTLNRNDKIITGIFWYGNGTMVNSSDTDFGAAPLVSITAEKHAENIAVNGKYDFGEYVYTSADNIVNNGDTRLSWVIAGGKVYPKGSIVDETKNDKDVGINLINFNDNEKTTDINNLMIYLVTDTGATTVSAGDTRLFNLINSVYSPGTAVVTNTDTDVGTSLFPFATNEKYVGFDTTTYNLYDPIYRDMDSNGSVSEGDIRLTDFSIYIENKHVLYTAGSVVRKGELDVGLQLNAFTNDEKHTELGTPNSKFDPGERIYRSNDNQVNVGDIRFNAYGVISSNLTVPENYFDAGLTLTKGWAEITDEIVTAYANGGEKVLNLNHYPVVKPVIPPEHDINYILEPLTITGGDLKGKGKVYYTVTAVSDTVGESEPWEEKWVEFTVGTAYTSARIKWSPVSNASRYRVYRTFEEGVYSDNSLIAEVKAPVTEYIDLGFDGLAGKPPERYASSFTKLYLTTLKNPQPILLFEWELSDYKLDTTSGRIDFRKALKELDTIVADYSIGISVVNEVVNIDYSAGKGKLRYSPVIDPSINEDLYKIKLRKATAANPDNPTPLVRGVDYEFRDDKNSIEGGLEKGTIVFYTQIASTDTIYADYHYREDIRGDLIKVATGNETSLYTHEKGIVVRSYTVMKGITLRTSPVINVLSSDKGPLITFTTPINIKPNPQNKINISPDSPRDVYVTFSLQAGIRNPAKSGNYQMFVRTSKEQTEILSDPYEIIAGEETQKLVKLTPDQSVPAGSSIALTTAVQDELGNYIPNITIVYSIISSPENGGKLDKTTFVTDTSGKAVAMYTTSPTPGENLVQAKILGTTQSVLFKITGLSSQLISKIVVSPEQATIPPKSSRQFSAIAYDSSNNIVPGVKFTWSVDPATLGTITQDGYFTAGEALGSGRVEASAYGIKGYSSITIASTGERVSSITIEPKQVTVVIGKTQLFTAKAFDSNGNILSDVAFTWQVVPDTLGTITDTGLFTAKSIGSGVVIASTEGKQVIAAVTVVSNIKKVVVQPSSITLKVNDTQVFTAQVYDESDNLIPGAQVNWSVTGDIGEITQTGIFTALKEGQGQVVASAGGVVGTAVVVVTKGTIDTEGPEIQVLFPIEGQTIVEEQVIVKGTVKDPSGVKMVLVNGAHASYDPISGTFTSQPIKLLPGTNSITIIAEDNIGNRTTKIVNVNKGCEVVIKLTIGSNYAGKTSCDKTEILRLDLAPFIQNGRTLVPLRFIAESFGAQVDWIEDASKNGEGTIIITLIKSDGTKIVIKMHTKVKTVVVEKTAPGQFVPVTSQLEMEVAPFIVKPANRTVVPIRFIAEGFGAQVDWNQSTQEITISYLP